MRPVAACVVLVAIALPGCLIPTPRHSGGAYSDGRLRLGSEEVDALAVGESTMESVVLDWGEPEAVWGDSNVFVYTWVEVIAYVVVAAGYTAGGFPICDQSVLVLTFDENGVLRSVGAGQDGPGPRRGSSRRAGPTRGLGMSSGGDRDDDGFPGSVDELFARHRDRLRRLVLSRLDRRLRGRVDASDVLQETHLEAARRLREYVEDPDRMPFFLWLRFIAVEKVQQVAP